MVKKIDENWEHRNPIEDIIPTKKKKVKSVVKPKKSDPMQDFIMSTLGDTRKQTEEPAPQTVSPPTPDETSFLNKVAPYISRVSDSFSKATLSPSSSMTGGLSIPFSMADDLIGPMARDALASVASGREANPSGAFLGQTGSGKDLGDSLRQAIGGKAPLSSMFLPMGPLGPSMAMAPGSIREPVENFLLEQVTNPSNIASALAGAAGLAPKKLPLPELPGPSIPNLSNKTQLLEPTQLAKSFSEPATTIINKASPPISPRLLQAQGVNPDMIPGLPMQQKLVAPPMPIQPPKMRSLSAPSESLSLGPTNIPTTAKANNPGMMGDALEPNLKTQVQTSPPVNDVWPEVTKNQRPPSPLSIEPQQGESMMDWISRYYKTLDEDKISAYAGAGALGAASAAGIASATAKDTPLNELVPNPVATPRPQAIPRPQDPETTLDPNDPDLDAKIAAILKALSS